MLVYRTLIEISLLPLPLPLRNSSHYHPWILAIVFLSSFPPSNSILDRVSILKYNHHNTAENPSTTFYCFGKRMQTTQCDLHKIQRTLAPLYLISLFPFSYLTHSPLKCFQVFFTVTYSCAWDHSFPPPHS